jgi:hypothetical protein
MKTSLGWLPIINGVPHSGQYRTSGAFLYDSLGRAKNAMSNRFGPNGSKNGVKATIEYQEIFYEKTT